MNIIGAILLLSAELALLVAFGYVIIRWWYIAMWVGMGLFLDYSLLMAGFKVWVAWVSPASASTA